MQASRPADPKFAYQESHRGIKGGVEPLTIKAGVVLSVGNEA